jgi:hypothetical protein
MLAFIVVWIGQIVSLLGSAMSHFALTIWAYEKTESATALALVGFFFVGPMLLVSPIAGAIVDRSNRRFMMMISDLAAGTTTLAILILISIGKLEIWHLYITGAISGVFNAFQWPAYSAAISTMLPKEQYGRANGMMALADTASGIIAPILAGALLGIIGLVGVLLIDVVTFVFAISALLVVTIPQPRRTAEGQKSQGNLLKEASYGFYYILARPSLLALQIVFLLGNFFVGIPFAVGNAMILASSQMNELVLASVNSVGAIGGVVGGVVMSAWGGPKRRVHGVLAGWAISSLLGTITMGLANSLPGWAFASFMGAFFVPLINGSNQAIWQAKVAPDLQGRVFSIRRLIAWFVSPLAMLIAGPLADFVLEPGMMAGGSLTGLFSSLVGTGPGAGMSLMFVFGGLLALGVCLAGYLFPVLRNAEDLLPDHDQMPAASSDTRHQRLQELLEARQRLITTPPSQAREDALKDISRQLREIGRSSTPV